MHCPFSPELVDTKEGYLFCPFIKKRVRVVNKKCKHAHECAYSGRNHHSRKVNEKLN